MSDDPKPAGELVRGIVLTHGSMCHGLVDAVRKIAGAPEDALQPLSNDGRNPDDLLHAVAAAAEKGPVLIFTDMVSGSCALAARFVCRDPGSRQVIFGVNLPILLDFVFHRDLSLEELVPRLLERGRSSIRSLETRTSTGGHHAPSSG